MAWIIHGYRSMNESEKEHHLNDVIFTLVQYENRPHTHSHL